jgi:hypothetical protein
MLAAVFISNVPEGLSSTAGMKKAEAPDMSSASGEA